MTGVSIHSIKTDLHAEGSMINSQNEQTLERRRLCNATTNTIRKERQRNTSTETLKHEHTGIYSKMVTNTSMST